MKSRKIKIHNTQFIFASSSRNWSAQKDIKKIKKDIFYKTVILDYSEYLNINTLYTHPSAIK